MATTSAGTLIYSDRAPPPLACVATAALKHLGLERQPTSDMAKDDSPIIKLLSGEELQGSSMVVRYLARSKQDDLFLYGHDALSSCQVDQWLAFAPSLSAGPGLLPAAAAANVFLESRTYLVGHRLTLADVAVWGELAGNLQWARANPSDMPHLQRWLEHVGAHPVLSTIAKQLGPKTKEQHIQASQDAGHGGGDTGSFLKLKGAAKGKVVTRFPPEPSGYLHIGHAKAALLNQHYASVYEGRLLVRFDDTNPSKEKDEYVENILADIKCLGLRPEKITYTSDYFPQLQEVTEKLIMSGVIYADDTPQPEMAEQRSHPDISKRISRCAGREPKESLRIFKEMLAGSPEGLANCLRFKIVLEEGDAPTEEKNRGHMAMGNGALRDPVAFRCNASRHWRTGDQYKAYPTYDLACPFVDAVEGVTHALRSSEYSDREPQFYWILKRLQQVWPGLPDVEIEDFSRLNLQNTVLSKRQLTQLVDSGKVDGWADPRMPTVQGVLRRGLQLAALKEFIVSQGASKNTNLMEWGVIWAVNKSHIDPLAPRHTRVLTGGPGVLPPVVFTVENGPESPETAEAPLHKKNPKIGTKTVHKLKRVLIDAVDAAEVAAAIADADAGSTATADGSGRKPLSEKKAAERRHVTLMDWGQWPAVLVTEVTKDEHGAVTAVRGHQVEGYKANDTFLKLTWLADVDEARTALQIVRLGPLIKEAKVVKKAKNRPGLPPAPEQPQPEIGDLFNENSRSEYLAWGDSNLRRLKRGQFLQLERDGYYTVDRQYDESKPDQPILLVDIPDGKDKRPIPSVGAQTFLDNATAAAAATGSQGATLKSAGAGTAASVNAASPHVDPSAGSRLAQADQPAVSKDASAAATTTAARSADVQDSQDRDVLKLQPADTDVDSGNAYEASRGTGDVVASGGNGGGNSKANGSTIAASEDADMECGDASTKEGNKGVRGSQAEGAITAATDDEELPKTTRDGSGSDSEGGNTAASEPEARGNDEVGGADSGEAAVAGVQAKGDDAVDPRTPGGAVDRKRSSEDSISAALVAEEAAVPPTSHEIAITDEGRTPERQP